MHIRKDNCQHCQGNQFKDHFLPVSYTCRHCNHQSEMTFAVNNSDVRLITLNILNPFTFFTKWKQVVHTTDQFCLTKCEQCTELIMIDPETPIGLPCDFCDTVHEYPIRSEVMHALPDGKIMEEVKVMGAGYRIKMWSEAQTSKIEDTSDCPSCNSPIPPFSGHTTCASCDRELFALSSCGYRILPGFQVRGYIHERGEPRNISGWYTLSEFETLYQQAKSAVGNTNPFTDSMKNPLFKSIALMFGFNCLIAFLGWFLSLIWFLFKS